MFLRACDKFLEALDCPESRVYGLMSSVGGADRPWTARIACAGGERPVTTLASSLPDRVDRGQVEDIDAELGEPRQLLTDAAKATPRARKELIPGAEARARTIDVERQRMLECHRCRAIGMALQGTEQLVPEGHVVLGSLRRIRVLEQRERLIDDVPVFTARAMSGLAQQDHAL